MLVSVLLVLNAVGGKCWSWSCAVNGAVGAAVAVAAIMFSIPS